MTWEDTFYRINNLEISDGLLNAVVGLNKEHPIYKGHFPKQPIVPGVCTLAIIKKVISLCLKRNVSFKKIKECKFLSALVPGECNIIMITIKYNDEGVIVANVTANDKIALKLKATIN